MKNIVTNVERASQKVESTLPPEVFEDKLEECFAEILERRLKLWVGRLKIVFKFPTTFIEDQDACLLPISTPHHPPFYHDIQRSHIKALALFVPRRDSVYLGKWKLLGPKESLAYHSQDNSL